MSSESVRLGQSAIDRIFFSDHLIDTDPFRSAIFLFLSFIELSRKGPPVQRSVTNKVKQRVVISIITKSTHSSEIKRLCLIKWPSKMFQYLFNTVFVFQKYGKFWSIFLGHFFDNKSLISEKYTNMCDFNATLKDVNLIVFRYWWMSKTWSLWIQCDMY